MAEGAAQLDPLAAARQTVDQMITSGSQAADIEKYLAGVGITREELRGDTIWDKTKRVVGGATDAVIEAARGKHDPKFAHLPAFSFQGIIDPKVISKIEKGKMVTYDDPAYGDVVKSALGDRVLKTEKDANGYDVLTYKGDDGEPVQAYLNKPGLDMQDVERAAVGSIPFMAAGGAAAIPRVGLMARTGLQALTGGATSLAADAGAAQLGSKQGYDPVRAGIAAGGGAAAELLSPAVSAFFNAAVKRPSLFRSGELTEKGKELAANMGLDPEAMSTYLARRFAGEATVAASPAEVGIKYRAAEFGLPASVGQRTKDPAQLGVEEEMRRGLFGTGARDVMTDFDAGQKKAVEGAVYDRVGRQIAPDAPAQGRSPGDLGTVVQTAAADALAAEKLGEAAIWKETGAMFPQDAGFALLRNSMRTKLRDNQAVPSPNMGSSPVSNDMLSLLDDYAGGKLQERELPLIGKGASSIFLDDVRRSLLAKTRDAAPGSNDARISKHIYDGFNEWIGELADKALLVGKPEAHAKLVAARAFTQDMKNLFEPEGAVGKKIGAVLGDADTPEGVLDALMGRTVTGAPQNGGWTALAHMKKILSTNPEHQGAWDALRLAYWVKIAQDRKGEVLSPQRLKNNIDEAFHNQKSIVELLFDKEERDMIKRLSTSLDDLTYKPPNPSGTSYELERMRQREKDPSLSSMLERKAASQVSMLKSGTPGPQNVMMARIYRTLARNIPGAPFGAKGLGERAAEKAISQDVTRAQPYSLGPMGAAVGADLE